MSDLTDADAELAFRWLPEPIRDDIAHDAHQRTVNQWADERPDDLDRLETAHNDSESPFAWEDIDLTFERSQIDGSEELTPHTYTGDAADEVHSLAREFGWDYVDAVRDGVRRTQNETDLSPREFVAFVLAESPITWQEAATLMGIADGTFSSKMEREVRPQIESCRATVQFVDRVQN